MKYASAAALLLSVTACNAADDGFFVGPCSSDKRVGPDSVYRGLALTMATQRTPSSLTVSSDQDREAKLKAVEDLRRDWLPTIADECLRAHVSDWLGVTTRVIATKNTGSDESYEARQAREEDQQRSLAEKLGVRRK
jgi:hypothetical protein